MQTSDSHDNIEAACIFAAESGNWEVDSGWDLHTSDIITIHPSQHPTRPVGEVESLDDDGIYAALDRGVPLSVVMAVAACR
jgi:hypothetical protein